MNLFGSAKEAEDELFASGATLLGDAEELLNRLTETDFCFTIPFLLQAWFALVPRGCRAPEITYESLQRTFRENLQQLVGTLESQTPQKMEAFFQSGPQPNLMLVLLSEFLRAAANAPKDFRPRPEAQPLILALLKSVVDVLDAALRDDSSGDRRESQ